MAILRMEIPSRERRGEGREAGARTVGERPRCRCRASPQVRGVVRGDGRVVKEVVEARRVVSGVGRG